MIRAVRHRERGHGGTGEEAGSRSLGGAEPRLRNTGHPGSPRPRRMRAPLGASSVCGASIYPSVDYARPGMPMSEFEALAKNVVRRTLRVRPKENVIVECWNHGLDAAREIVYQLRSIGARSTLLFED